MNMNNGPTNCGHKIFGEHVFTKFGDQTAFANGRISDEKKFENIITRASEWHSLYETLQPRKKNRS